VDKKVFINRGKRKFLVCNEILTWRSFSTVCLRRVNMIEEKSTFEWLDCVHCDGAYSPNRGTSYAIHWIHSTWCNKKRRSITYINHNHITCIHSMGDKKPINRSLIYGQQQCLQFITLLANIFVIYTLIFPTNLQSWCKVWYEQTKANPETIWLIYF
jgi:hypothetical protein